MKMDFSINTILQMTEEKANEVMIDSFFLDLPRKYKTIALSSPLLIKFNNISGEAVYQMYKVGYSLRTIISTKLDMKFCV